LVRDDRNGVLGVVKSGIRLDDESKRKLGLLEE
jgi:hypothetical protein